MERPERTADGDRSQVAGSGRHRQDPADQEGAIAMWTYYKQDFPNGVWSLFREDEQHRQEIFHRKKGWQPSDELFERKAAGDVDRDDVISEAEADALVRSIGKGG